MWLTWREATERALYGDGGFYLRSAPATQFRTSVHASPRFAHAVLALLTEVDTALGRPSTLDLVDVGAGRGELMGQIAARATNERLHLTAVELAASPADLPDGIAWTPTMPTDVTGLVIANEWLDNVPVDVAELTPDGPRLLLVDPATGDQRPGPPVPADDAAWLTRWWPLAEVGDRAEIGRPRDDAWATVVSRLRRGMAVAIDYGHRLSARPSAGTVSGYRDGRQVPPLPDGSCDITSHVALDACAAAVQADDSRLTTQREALRALGIRAQAPPTELARTDPPGYLRALAAAGEERELIDSDGLGGFHWLIHTIRLTATSGIRVIMNG
jgi:SAM-dependent MidA family methyltransferase